MEQEKVTGIPAKVVYPWYSRRGFPMWLAIVVCLLILAIIPFTPHDAPARLWVFLAAVVVAIALYIYSHPKDEAAAAEKAKIEQHKASRDGLE